MGVHERHRSGRRHPTARADPRRGRLRAGRHPGLRTRRAGASHRCRRPPRGPVTHRPPDRRPLRRPDRGRAPSGAGLRLVGVAREHRGGSPPRATTPSPPRCREHRTPRRSRRDRHLPSRVGARTGRGGPRARQREHRAGAHRSPHRGTSPDDPRCRRTDRRPARVPQPRHRLQLGGGRGGVRDPRRGPHPVADGHPATLETPGQRRGERGAAVLLLEPVHRRAEPPGRGRAVDLRATRHHGRRHRPHPYGLVDRRGS